MTAGHSIFDVEIEKDIECKEHQDEVVSVSRTLRVKLLLLVRFYCESCETYVYMCVVSTVLP